MLVNAVFNRNESSDDRKKHEVESKFRLRNIIPRFSIVYRVVRVTRVFLPLRAF